MSMKISNFIARQYAKPSGAFGRLITGSLLNRANAKSNEAVFDLLNVSPESRVLEVGFGGGDLLFNIHKRCNCESINGVEISPAMLKRAENKVQRLQNSENIKLEFGDVNSLPFQNDQFDRVCSVNTVYFWPDLSKSIQEISRVTEAEGIFVLGFGSDIKMRQAGFEEKGFILRKPNQIQEALMENGFDILERRVLNREKRGSFYVLKSKKT